MKDLGHLIYFLGLEVFSESNGYYLSQTKYTSDLIARAGLTDSKTITTHYNLILNLYCSKELHFLMLCFIDNWLVVLIYQTITHPDISHVVHLVSQDMVMPRSTHYAIVIHILPYVKGTIFYGLHFSAHSSLELRAYSNAD